MKNEAHGGGNESLESYKEHLSAWGQELVDRALEADLSGEDCAKIEQFVAATIEAGINAFNGETLPWTKAIFERVVEKCAKSSSPEDVDMVQRLLASHETAAPIVTPEEAATIPALHVPKIETAASEGENVPVSTTTPVLEERVSHDFDRAKWSNPESSPEETYSKYSESVQRIAEKKIADLSRGASPEEAQTIREVIEGLRDHVLLTAQEYGPISFEQRLKYDATLQALALRRGATSLPSSPASVRKEAVDEKKDEPVKSFADLASLRDALPLIHEEHEQEAKTAIEQAPMRTHRSATHEPPETITEVATELPATPLNEETVIVPEAGQEKAAVSRLNELKTLIDAEYQIIRATKDENKRDALSGRKITEARRRLEEFHQESKAIAANLVGGEALFAVVKPADDAASRLYESQIPRKTAKDERREKEATLPEGAVDAYYEAVRRKNAFADMLVQKGVAKDIAYDLYREFTHQAQELEILKEVLDRGEENAQDVLSTGRAQKVLEWHGITAREPEAALAAIALLVDLYHTLPQKKERATKNAPQAKMSPTALLSELLLSGKEDITLVPRSMLEQLAAGENETIKNMAREELARLEAAEGERTRNTATVAPHEEAAPAPKEEGDAQLVSLLLSGVEDIGLVPRSKLRQLAKNDDPLIREMAEKELAKLEEQVRTDTETVAPAPRVPASPAQAPQVGTAAVSLKSQASAPTRLSGRQMEDLIESTEGARQWRNSPTTAEDAFEIKQGRAVNKAATGRGPSIIAPLSAEAALSSLPLVEQGTESIAQNVERKNSSQEKFHAEFREFCTEHRDELKDAFERNNVSSYLYKHFYSCTASPRYRDGDPATESLVAAYNTEIAALLEKLSAVTDKDQQTFVSNGYWLYSTINNGAPRGERVGRFYLNIVPEQMALVYPELLRVLKEKGIGAEIKIPVTANAHALNRADSLVFYFGDDQQERAMAVLQEFYAGHQDAFFPESPRLTASLPDQEGHAMQGIGFGAEPRGRAGSFGQVRSGILEHVLYRAEQEGKSIHDPSFDFDHAFQVGCKLYGVDPEAPAFNIGSDEDEAAENLFATIKEASQSIGRERIPALSPSETRESLDAKLVLVGGALALFFGKTGQVQGGHLTEAGVAQLRNALIACNYPGLDEERLNSGEVAYVTELEQWLRTEHERLLLSVRHEPESAQVLDEASALQFAEAEPMVSIEALLLQEDPAPEAEEKKSVLLNHGVVRQFNEKFGLSEVMLEMVPGFSDLSTGQQLLVLKNLEQIALTDIKKEATGQQKEEWGKLPAWKRMWKQSYSFGMNPEYRTRELEKELLAKYRRPSDVVDAEEHVKIAASHLAHMEQLVKVASEGPEVQVHADGTLEMSFVSLEGVHYTPEQQQIVDAFNGAASTFAQLPREWGYKTEDERGMFMKAADESAAALGLTRRNPGNYRSYKDAAARYAVARANMLQLYSNTVAKEIALDPTRSGEDPAQSAMQRMNEADERVELNQLFNNHPDAEAALQQIEDQNTIAAAAKEFWKSKGMFIAGGALVRGATIALSGGIMLPVIGLVGAGVGGAIGAAEGKKLMKAKLIDGRMSEEDMREEVVATNVLTGKAIMGSDGKPMKRQIREYTDAAFFTDRVDRLTEKLFDTTESKERALLEHKIAQTVALMNEKFERGMINFGGSSLAEGDERKGNTIANRLSFIQALAKGQLSNVIDQGAIEAKMERVTGLRQATIEEKRKAEIKKIAAKSALIRGAFALAGAGVVEGVKQIAHFGEVGYLGASSDASASSTGTAGAENTPAASYADAPPDSANPEAFNAANFDKNISDVLGRTPSAEELSALRSTGGVDDPATANMDRYNALVGAISGSSAPLSHVEIESILGGGAATEISEGAFSANPAPTAEAGEVAALSYEVKSGDTLTRIMREEVSALKDFTPEEQENVIQNFIRSLSPEEMQAIGITDANTLAIGQRIHLDALNELLLNKQVGGENILTHAQELVDGYAAEGGTAEAVTEGTAPSATEVTPSSPETAVPENVAELTPVQRASLWGQLSEANKNAYITEATPRYIAADMGELFAKGPFEEWPKEWVSLRGRSAEDLLAQTEKTDPHTFLPTGTEEVPAGYEWSVVSKIQQYIEEHGLNSAHGITPRQSETLEEFLHRGMSERMLREGPLPWLNQ